MTSTGGGVSDPRWKIDFDRKSDGIVADQASTMGHLPQGAPTSPSLSNLVSIALDDALLKLAAKYELIYTRYSDDLTFSTGRDFSHLKAKELLREAAHILSSFGHTIHRKKTKIAPPGARKIVLGVLVDLSKLKIPLNVRKRISDHVRGIEKFELKRHAVNRHFISLWGMICHVRGLLNFANEVDPTFSKPLGDRLSKALAKQRWPATP